MAGTHIVAALAFICVGCADDFVMKVDLGGRDFSGTVVMDMTVGDDDLATPAVDMAQQLDLGPSLDLTPIFCDLGGPASTDAGTTGRLHLAVVGAGRALHTATYLPGGTGWSIYAVNGSTQLDDVALAIAGPTSNPLVVAKQTDTVVSASSYLPCTGTFAPLSQVVAAATTSMRPAVVSGALVDLVYRGSVNLDQRYYHSRFDGASWSAVTTQSNFLSNLEPTAVRQNGTVHSIFTGTNNKVYDGTVSNAVGGGTATEITGATSNFSPSAVITMDGALHVVYVSNNGADNTQLFWTTRASGVTTFTAPQYLCTGQGGGCFIVTDKAPVLAVDSSGSPIVAWHGTNDRVYTSTLSGTTWGTAIEASNGETTNFLHALASGIAGASAEVAYVRSSDGYVRHGRLVAGTWQSHVTLSGTSVQSSPALIPVF